MPARDSDPGRGLLRITRIGKSIFEDLDSQARFCFVWKFLASHVEYRTKRAPKEFQKSIGQPFLSGTCTSPCPHRILHRNANPKLMDIRTAVFRKPLTPILASIPAKCQKGAVSGFQILPSANRPRRYWQIGNTASSTSCEPLGVCHQFRDDSTERWPTFISAPHARNLAKNLPQCGLQSNPNVHTAG